MTRKEQNKILHDKIESNINQYKVDYRLEIKEIRDNLAGRINIPAGLVIPPGPQGPPPPSPSPINITTPSTSPPTAPSIAPIPPSPSLTNIITSSTSPPIPPSPSSSLTNVTPLGLRRSRIPRPSVSQSDLDLKDLFRPRKQYDLDELISDLEYSDMLNKLRSRPDFDVDKLLDEF